MSAIIKYVWCWVCSYYSKRTEKRASTAGFSKEGRPKNRTPARMVRVKKKHSLHFCCSSASPHAMPHFLFCPLLTSQSSIFYSMSLEFGWSLHDWMVGFGKVCHPLILLFFFSYKQVPIYNLYSSNSADWPFPSQDPHPMLDLCPIPQAISLLVNPTAFLSVIFQIITSLRTTTYTHFFKHILLQVS